jgi:hypothetical protein
MQAGGGVVLSKQCSVGHQQLYLDRDLVGPREPEDSLNERAECATRPAELNELDLATVRLDQPPQPRYRDDEPAVAIGMMGA